MYGSVGLGKTPLGFILSRKYSIGNKESKENNSIQDRSSSDVEFCVQTTTKCPFVMQNAMRESDYLHKCRSFNQVLLLLLSFHYRIL